MRRRAPKKQIKGVKMEARVYEGKSFRKEHGEFCWHGVYQEVNSVLFQGDDQSIAGIILGKAKL